MIAEVGDIVKVSGSRIATPLAPPRPGRTPISTPSMMPTNIRPMFIGVRTTAKPCSRAQLNHSGLHPERTISSRPRHAAQ